MQFESITMLKHKFEEIKNNILNIEKEKLKKFEELQLITKVNRNEIVRPASASRIRPERAEQESELVQSLRLQVFKLQKENQEQSLTIQNLKNENSRMKGQLDQFVLRDKINKERPQSCLRSNSSSPKKKVAFAKDLTSVKYFSPKVEEPENCSSNLSKSSDFSWQRSTDTTPRPTIYQRSLRCFLDQKRSQMNKLNIKSFDSQISEYFKERSERLAASMFKE